MIFGLKLRPFIHVLFALSVCLGAFTVSAQPPDLIIVNGVVRTIDEKTPRAEAIAIRGERVVAVGSNASIRRLSGPTTRVYDAGGRLVLPGFNDSHVHFTGVGNWFSHLDLRGVGRAEEVYEKLAHFTRFVPAGRWIIGAGLDPEKLSPAKLDRSQLDRLSANNPILLYLKDPSSAVANSAALKSARIGPSDRLLIDSKAGLAAIRSAIPANHGFNWAEIAEAASNYAASRGVTTIQDVHSDDLYDTYVAMAAAGKLKTRVLDCVGLLGWEKGGAKPVPDKGRGMVRRGCVKWLADGDVENRAELTDRLARADRAGMQIAVHAIGSRAIENTITALENVIKANGPRDRRPRIEHARGITADQVQRSARSGIIASMQPALFYYGPDSGDIYPEFLRTGAHLALGSDASMIDIDPMDGIYAAVNSGSNSLSVHDAVRAYTLGAAYAEFQEKEKGTIALGKLADVVVLSRDIFSIPKEQIKGTRVDLTVVGGKIVFERTR